MEDKIVKIINEMAEYLNVAQMKKLQEVLLQTFSESEAQKEADLQRGISEAVP